MIGVNVSVRTFVLLTLAAPLLVSAMGCANGGGSSAMQSNLTWYAPLPELRPPAPNKRTVAIMYRDVTAQEPFDVRKYLKTQVQSNGYTVVDDPEMAEYQMRVTLRSYGVNDRADKGQSTVSAAGDIVENPNANVHTVNINVNIPMARADAPSDSGPTPMDWAHDPLGTALRPKVEKLVEYDLLVDLVVAERIDGGVMQAKTSDTDTRLGAGRSSPGEAGRQLDRTQVTETSKQTLTHSSYKSRFLVYAQKPGLTNDEARTTIETKAKSALANVLPVVN